MLEESGHHITARASQYRRGRSRVQWDRGRTCISTCMVPERHISKEERSTRVAYRVHHIPGLGLQKRQEAQYNETRIFTGAKWSDFKNFI